MTILIVDDDSDVADLIQEVLLAHGYRCLRAGNADEADRLLAAEHVDGLTLDMRMPGRSGLEWLDSLAISQPDLARRTLLITGSYLRNEECCRLKGYGAELLFKPFDNDRMVETLQGQLARLPATGNLSLPETPSAVQVHTLGLRRVDSGTDSRL